MTSCCPVPWCYDHTPTPQGEVIHHSRQIAYGDISMILERIDGPIGPGRVHILLCGHRLSAVDARQLANALREAAQVAEHL